MIRARAGVLLLCVAITCAACAQPSAATSSPSAIQSPSARPHVALPAPSLHPRYPPVDLPDLVALADQGVARRFIGMEGQPLTSCSRGWLRVDEPAGLAPQQMAADLLKVSIDRHVLTKSCGGYIFGTTDRTFCNCYHAEHGYLAVERGADREPAPGKMSVFFGVTDTDPSPADWEIIVDAPDV